MRTNLFKGRPAKLLALAILILTGTGLPLANQAQGPDWANIKAHYRPFIANPADYDTARIQNMANAAWEDGMYMSRDGKHMYCFYTPMDVISYSQYLDTLPGSACPVFFPYIRGPFLGLDTSTTVPPCPSWIHSDIAYTSRPDLFSPFAPWTLSGLKRPLSWDGAPQIISAGDSIEIMCYTSLNGSNNQDIFWLKNSPHNPGTQGQPLPAPINSTRQEDNPHMERLDANTLVLLFDYHAEEPEDSTDIYYSLSTDNGNTWLSPQKLSSINTPDADELHPHLWWDSSNNKWWLYFAAKDTASGSLGQLSIFRAELTDTNNIDSWGPRELVLGPGRISNGSGEVIGVGEPTLSWWGDLSFIVIYGDLGSADPTDKLDADPWFLPRKGSPLAISHPVQRSHHSLTLYPNPATHHLSFELPEDVQQQEFSIVLYDQKGQAVFSTSTTALTPLTRGANRHITLPTHALPNGLYTLILTATREEWQGGGRFMVRR